MRCSDGEVRVDDVQQSHAGRRRTRLGAAYDDLVAGQIVAVNLNANLVAGVELECRWLVHDASVARAKADEQPLSRRADHLRASRGPRRLTGRFQ